METINERIYFVLIGYEREAYNAKLRGDMATVEACVERINEIKSKYNI